MKRSAIAMDEVIADFVDRDLRKNSCQFKHSS
jgi:hypothetical protein